MLRLDPAFPPLWRSDTTMQLGPDTTLVVENPSPWQERLLDELSRGVPEIALESVARMLGAPPAQATPFVERIWRALESSAPPAAGAIALRLPPGLYAADAVALSDGLGAVAGKVSTADAEALLHERPAAGVPVVLVAHHVVDPRHVAVLMRDDVAHLPVVFSGRDVVVGPLVRPGETACLACLEAHRRDSDPSWPIVAAQLVGRPGASPGRASATEAGVAAGRLLTEPERRIAHSVRICADSPRRVWRAHRPHEECGCRSPAGTATADEPASLATATTTAKAKPPHA